MPKTVFYYFPFKGRGESGRLLLAYGGEEFEDKRITGKDWPAFKPHTPFGQMPVLEIDGKKNAQSFAIARYLGRKYGLAGADAEEDFEIDQNVEFLNDIHSKGANVYSEANEEIKAQKHADFTKNVYPALLNKLDAIIKANNGHVACKKLTWADFMFAGSYSSLKVFLRRPDLDEEFPSFKKVEQLVYSLPKVKAFADAAPHSNM